MIVVGGRITSLAPSWSDDFAWTADPWPKCIGVFDLSAMEWKDSYDPSAPSYVTPQPIKDYIAENGRYPAWSDPATESWFTNNSE